MIKGLAIAALASISVAVSLESMAGDGNNFEDFENQLKRYDPLQTVR